ncbi:MAG TPA: molybdate ABC transporter substrate-binding protein [Gemmatimonadales bacterium]|jgi:molybdate transport system substrate-binding protein
MKIRVALFAAITLVASLVCTADAQTEITLLSPNPIEDAINTVVADFEAKTGTHVAVTYGTGVSTRNTVASGKALDVSLLFAPFPDAVRTGNIVPDSATVIARLRLGVAVKKGAPKPDISTADAVRRTFLNAASIVAIDPERGSAGGAALAALEKLGITEQVKPKMILMANAGGVQDSVAKGQYEIALGPYFSEMRNPGLDIVGALPPDAATPIDITGFISTTTKNAQAARALLDYLASPAATPVYEKAKLFPVLR